MKKRILALTILVGCGAIVWTLTQPKTPKPGSPAVSQALLRPPYDPTQLVKTIAFYENRVRADPGAAIESGMLAGFYLQRCRETGDLADALRAEKAARHSLAIRTRHNTAAYNMLALSLFTQHRFAEARSIAEAVLKANPEDLQARQIVAENRMELGDYAGAESVLRDSSAPHDDVAGMALRARMLEIDGQPEQALALLRKAQAAADRNYDMPRENTAWFHMRVGEVQAAMGRSAEAEQAYRVALEIFPQDHRTLTALTRLAAGRGAWEETVAWGQKAAAIVPTPEVVALIGDAYTALGKAKEAAAQYHLVEAIGRLTRTQGIVYDRQRALFCADHDRNLDEALRLARGEMKVRHDVYASDTLAWVCCKKGLLTEADAAMQKALMQHTQDARMLYHAGMIAEARGDHARAKTYLTRALEINPAFAPFAPAQAKTLLARL
jgi:tetratricopeptide (TPR) repeat protein